MVEKYDPKKEEARWQSFWDGEYVYAFNPDSKTALYTIDTPPPTMSGKMHIGHAYSYSQQDFLARFWRMRGFNMFFPFGTDDNGLPTERMIEKLKNVKCSAMDRTEFIALCLKTLDELRPPFVGDWKKLGISCDFSLLYSTINDHCRKISQWSFLDLYQKGRVYRKEAPTIWCTECRTAIAQAELQDSEKQTEFVHVEVLTTTGERLVFATTRPELMMACIAITVHPDDKRYTHLVGKKARIPATTLDVPILADTLTKMEFGTGVVYWCPFGDASDVEFVAKHPELLIKHIKNPDGTLNDLAGPYAGLTLTQARKKVIEEWKKAGAIKKMEQIKHVVNVHERCGTPAEYLVSRQWFVKYLDLKETFLELGEKLQWYPSFMKLRYDNWVRGLKWDWCISRQRYFGIPFPVWYCTRCGETIVADERQLPCDPLKDKPMKNCSCGSAAFEPEKDVLDTWATSSLTPLIAAKLLNKKPIYKKLAPMSLRPQGHDIISTWLFYTVAKNHLHFNKLPWERAAISGWVLDPLGKKMSKSKGNVIAPQDIMEKYSADALRFAAATAKLGEDVMFQEKELVTGTKLVTKLWNASQFCFTHLQGYTGTEPKQFSVIDRWLLSKLTNVLNVSLESFEQYEYSKTKLEAEKFFWHTFCDYYVEVVKDRLYSERRDTTGTKFVLYHALFAVLQLFAPFMPHITESIYQTCYRQTKGIKSIHLTTWPEPPQKWYDLQAERIGDFAIQIIEQARKYKSQQAVSLKKPVRARVKGPWTEAEFKEILDDVKATVKATEILYEQAHQNSFQFNL